MDEHQLLGVGLGAIIGVVLALTGAGGGILAVPLLVFGLGLS
ncbi:MAG: sulfite exporter TauE/SafE family protein, partial [Pseudomonas sp.]